MFYHLLDLSLGDRSKAILDFCFFLKAPLKFFRYYFGCSPDALLLFSSSFMVEKIILTNFSSCETCAETFSFLVIGVETLINTCIQDRSKIIFTSVTPEHLKTEFVCYQMLSCSCIVYYSYADSAIYTELLQCIVSFLC